jgi:RecA/RadA recombinase
MAIVGGILGSDPDFENNMENFSSKPEYLKQTIKEYGPIIKLGTEVLREKSEYRIISVSPAVDVALGGGIREGSWVTLTGDPKSGKSLVSDSFVYTPDGPVRIGDIKVGDKVVTPDGSTALVDGVFPQGKLDIYRVHFCDDTYVDCSWDHLWRVNKNYHGRYKGFEVMTLGDMVTEGLHYSDHPKWRIQLTQPLEFSQKDQPVPAWELGILLGDGGLTNRTPKLSTADDEIVERFSAFAKSRGLNFRHISNYDYALSHPDNGAGDNSLTNDLKNLGLMGLDSHQKFIPDCYKYGDIDQRFELVRGLMDSDGYNNNGGGAEFSTVSSALRDDVAEVIRSLGFKVKIVERYTKCEGKRFKSFRLHISGEGINQLFWLDRKTGKHERSKPTLMKKIVDVEILPSKEECVCIRVDHPDHLFVTDGMNVTHNTTTAMQIATNCQKEGRPIIYLDAEGRLKDMNFQVKGFDPSKIHVIAPDDKPIPAEDFLDIAYKLMSHPDYHGAVLIIDSISSLIPAKELDGDFSPKRAGLPKILSIFTKKVGQLLPRQRGLVIAITHYIANTAGFGKSKLADGGNKIQYQADTRMEIAGSGENSPAIKGWVVNEKRIGQIVNWKIICSSMGAPGGSVQSYIRYGHGIDKTQEVMLLGLDLGLIEKKGAWYTCSFLLPLKDELKKVFPELDTDNEESIIKLIKHQGEAKLFKFLDENSAFFDILENMIKELLD